MDYIALAIPFFFLLMGIEWVAATLLEKDVYRLNDAVNNLQTGILQQVLGVFSKVLVFGVYVAVWQWGRLIELPVQRLAGVGGLLPAGRPPVLLVPPHQPRGQPALGGAHRPPLERGVQPGGRPAAGSLPAPPSAGSSTCRSPCSAFRRWSSSACSAFNTLYQFWIHTRLIGKLGFLELFLNTPSHHRVHHGCDDKYLDRNYAGTFIVWDRLHGTFQVEGGGADLRGDQAAGQLERQAWANVHYCADLVELSRQAPNFREKMKVWLKGPAWKPGMGAEGPGRSREKTPLSHGKEGRYDAKAPRGLTLYAVVQFRRADRADGWPPLLREAPPAAGPGRAIAMVVARPPSRTAASSTPKDGCWAARSPGWPPLPAALLSSCPSQTTNRQGHGQRLEPSSSELSPPGPALPRPAPNFRRGRRRSRSRRRLRGGGFGADRSSFSNSRL